MVHTAQRGKAFVVIILLVSFIIFVASGFLKVWVVVNEGMKVDFVKIEESISVGKHNKQFVKKLKRNNLEDIQWVFGDYISM